MCSKPKHELFMLEKIWDMNNAASLYLSNIVRLIYVSLKEYALTQLCQRRALYLQCRATILSAQPYTDKFQLEMSSPSSSSSTPFSCASAGPSSSSGSWVSLCWTRASSNWVSVSKMSEKSRTCSNAHVLQSLLSLCSVSDIQWRCDIPPRMRT